MKGCLNASKCNSEDPPPFPIQQISICIKPCQLLIIIQYNKRCMSKFKKKSAVSLIEIQILFYKNPYFVGT